MWGDEELKLDENFHHPPSPRKNHIVLWSQPSSAHVATRKRYELPENGGLKIEQEDEDHLQPFTIQNSSGPLGVCLSMVVGERSLIRNLASG